LTSSLFSMRYMLFVSAMLYRRSLPAGRRKGDQPGQSQTLFYSQVKFLSVHCNCSGALELCAACGGGKKGWERGHPDPARGQPPPGPPASTSHLNSTMHLMGHDLPMMVSVRTPAECLPRSKGNRLRLVIGTQGTAIAGCCRGCLRG
jgi:hypothetical protein